MISILILTKNEEKNLPDCLESVKWSDDIHIYDSYSDDKTLEIGGEFGATITKRYFDSWSIHQNWGLKNIPFKHPWVFYIDADERMTMELKYSIKEVIKNPGLHAAYRVQRRDFYMETWLKNSQTSKYYIRLFRPDKIYYERLVNPVTKVHGSTGYIPGYLDHFPFNKGMSHWIDRHNSYSSFEAQQILENRKKNQNFSLIKAFFEKDFNIKRYHQKELFYRLPCRPLLKFLFLYIFKKGFLDGSAGYNYSLLQSIYEFMIILKTSEIQKSTNNTIS